MKQNTANLIFSLLIGALACALYQVADLRTKNATLKKMHDVDVEEMIRIDQSCSKPAKPKMHKSRPCVVYGYA